MSARDVFFSGGFKEESVFLPSPASRRFPHSLACGFFIFRASNTEPSVSYAAVFLVLSLSGFPLPPRRNSGPPGYSAHREVSCLITLVPLATLFPLCHVSDMSTGPRDSIVAVCGQVTLFCHHCYTIQSQQMVSTHYQEAPPPPPRHAEWRWSAMVSDGACFLICFICLANSFWFKNFYWYIIITQKSGSLFFCLE